MSAHIGAPSNSANGVICLDIAEIRIDDRTQSRVSLSEATVSEYAEVLRLGEQLPAVVVFDDGSDYWLADGFHRFHAYRAAELPEISCEIRQGTQRDAILYSVGANAAHGLRRSNADKQKAVMTLLNDAEWVTWSDTAIAKACGVSDKTVATHRKPIIGNSDDRPTVRVVERNGKKYEQKTKTIGKAKNTPPSVEPDAPEVGTVAEPVAEITPPAKVAIPKQGNAPAAPEQAPTDEDDEPTLEQQLSEARAVARETLADNEMMGRVFDADDKVRASMDEAIRQKAVADSAERQFNAQQGQLVALAKQVTYWQNRCEKAEKALKLAA